MSDSGAGPERLEAGPAASPTARRRWGVLLLVLAVLLAGGLAVRLTRPAEVADQRPSPRPSASRTPGTIRSTTTPAPTAPVVLRRSGPTLPGFDAGDLFLRSDDTVFRLRLSDGRVTATPADVGESAPVDFLVGRDGVLLLPPDVAGLIVRDDRAAEPLQGRLRLGNQVLPGPDGQFWVSETFDGRSSTFALTRLDGVRTGRTVRENGYFIPDGRGGLLLSDVGGVYESRNGSWRRLTTGSVVATGPRHLLVSTCDAAHDCGTFRYDRRTRALTRLDLVDRLEPYDGGALSPDGRYVASATYADTGTSGLEVLDLATGRAVAQTVTPENSYGTATVAAWSPDSRHLLALDEGVLVEIDPATGATTRPDLGLPDLLGLALRPPADDD